MCDNCKTLSVSGTVHAHVIFHFNGAESAGNKGSQLMPIFVWLTLSMKYVVHKRKCTAFFHRAYAEEFVAESEKEKTCIFLVFWNWLGLYPMDCRRSLSALKLSIQRILSVLQQFAKYLL